MRLGEAPADDGCHLPHIVRADRRWQTNGGRLGGEVNRGGEGEKGEIIHLSLIVEARVMVDGSNIVDVCPGICVIMFSNADLHRGSGVASCAVGRSDHMAAGDEGPTAPGGAVPRVHQAHLR